MKTGASGLTSLSFPAVTEGSLCMELTALSGSRLSVSFEHPQEDALATLEVELGSPLRCRLHAGSHSEHDQTTAHILQKSVYPRQEHQAGCCSVCFEGQICAEAPLVMSNSWKFT